MFTTFAYAPNTPSSGSSSGILLRSMRLPTGASALLLGSSDIGHPVLAKLKTPARAPAAHSRRYRPPWLRLCKIAFLLQSRHLVCGGGRCREPFSDASLVRMSPSPTLPQRKAPRRTPD